MKHIFYIRLGFRFWVDLDLAELVAWKHIYLGFLFCLKIKKKKFAAHCVALIPEVGNKLFHIW
jgi:hypothetical protein